MKVELPSSLYTPSTPYLPSQSQQNGPNLERLNNFFQEQSLVNKLFGSEFQKKGLNFIPQAAEPKKKIALFSKEYYAACTFGGAMCCGLTHAGVTPLDVVKCQNQVQGGGVTFGSVIRSEGYAGLTRGWFPCFIGYSIQGAFKYGLYEYFKKKYMDMAGEEFGHKYGTIIYLGASASAEFFADIGLCPFESVKVKTQTSKDFGTGLFDGMPKYIAAEGVGGLFKSITPLWGRQIPYTMMKFASFENIVQGLYAYVIPKPKSECNKTEQLGVSFVAGYLAGILCAIISQPADNLVSQLNKSKTATVGQIVKDMGIYGLCTRGLGMRIIMVGTLTGAQWGIYDSFKVYVGLPTTGSAAKAPEKKD